MSVLHMPKLAESFYGFHHTVDSALEALDDLGIGADRINIEMAGLGAPDRWVTWQHPAPGVEIDSGSRIRLRVAGLGFFERLPVAMWHRGDETSAGTDDILRPLDDPIEKAVHWVRQGARLFNIRREDPKACARWIRLFGLDPERWEQSHWYHLALLLPNLQALAGKEEGLRLALSLLLGVPLESMRMRPSARPIAAEDRSLLGSAASRLGVDSVVGDHVEELAEAVVRVGPVPLAVYRDYHLDNRELVEQTLRLATSCHRRWTLDWVVEDPTRAPRLGFAEQNARLGLNTHLGSAAAC